MELLPHGIDRGRPQTPRDHVSRAPTSILGPRGTTPRAGRRAPGKDSNQTQQPRRWSNHGNWCLGLKGEGQDILLRAFRVTGQWGMQIPNK